MVTVHGPASEVDHSHRRRAPQPSRRGSRSPRLRKSSDGAANVPVHELLAQLEELTGDDGARSVGEACQSGCCAVETRPILTEASETRVTDQRPRRPGFGDGTFGLRSLGASSFRLSLVAARATPIIMA